MSEEEVKALVEMKDMLKYENEKLKQEKTELIEWLKNKKEHCIKTKDSEVVDDLGKEQLLGCYLTCESLLEKLEKEIN